METRFSVLIPTYNRGEFLRDTIDSVLSQNFPNYELIVVDDGSTDKTWEVLQSYGDRIRTLRQTNKGAEVARHKAAYMASGQYLVLLDHDDILLPGALTTYARIIRELDAPPVIIAAMSSFITGQSTPTVDGEMHKIEVWKSRDLYARAKPPASSCSQLVVRKSVVDAAGALRREPTAFPFDTADILLSLGISGPFVAVKRPTTVAYRWHDSNTIRNLQFMVKTAPCLIRLERQGRYPGGASRLFSRWAYIGGVEIAWCVSAVNAKRFDLAAKLLLQSSPFVAAAILRKLGRLFHRTMPPIRLAK